MKKAISVLLMTALTFSLAGCYSAYQLDDEKLPTTVKTTHEISVNLDNADADHDVPPDGISQGVDDVHAASGNIFANRSSAGRLCRVGDCIYYSNVYDGMKLYRYDLTSNENSLVTEAVRRVQFISENDGVLYFSARADEHSERDSVYSLKNGGEPVLLIPDATAPFVYDGYIYFHKHELDFQTSVQRQSLDDGTIEPLIPLSYDISTMTVNFHDGYMYAANLAYIIRVDLESGEITQLTELTDYPNGINKLQLYGDHLYFYTYGDSASIMRMNVKDMTAEQVLSFNDGNFWHDVMIVYEDGILFSGRQNTAALDGEEFVRGFYHYRFEDETVERIGNTPGPTVYLYDGRIYCLMSATDMGENSVAVFDLDGNDLSDSYNFDN